MPNGWYHYNHTSYTTKYIRKTITNINQWKALLRWHHLTFSICDCRQLKGCKAFQQYNWFYVGVISTCFFLMLSDFYFCTLLSFANKMSQIYMLLESWVIHPLVDEFWFGDGKPCVELSPATPLWISVITISSLFLAL